MKTIKIATFLCLLFAVSNYGQTITAVVAGPVGSPALGNSNSVTAGFNAGNLTFTAAQNVFAGYRAGASVTQNGDNVYLGYGSGTLNYNGSNVHIGSNSGVSSTNAGRNVTVGYSAGNSLTTAGGNTFIGSDSGWSLTNKDWNTFVGYRAGYTTIGENNIAIGANVWGPGGNDNLLYIDNFDTNNTLIWGNFASDFLKFHAKVGIGGDTMTSFGTFSGNVFPSTANGFNISAYNLFVKGGILTEAVTINTFSGWADYVFSDDYRLMPLAEVEQYINANGHLPGVPSAEEISKHGFEFGDMTRIHQEKIEELTLHAIGFENQLQSLGETLPQQSAELDQLSLESSKQKRQLAELEAGINGLTNAKPN
jgi:hypothetical protein